MPARRITLRIQPPNPFGEVTMVPATLSGRPEADAARAMAAAFADSEAASTTDVLRRLRHSFPLAPLSERVAALSVIMSLVSYRDDSTLMRRDGHRFARAGTGRMGRA